MISIVVLVKFNYCWVSFLNPTYRADAPQVRRKIPRDKLKYKPKKRGDAPIGADGKPVELHHTDQDVGNKSPRDEMTMTDHRGKGNFKKNHPNTGQKPSAVDRPYSSIHCYIQKGIIQSDWAVKGDFNGCFGEV